MPVLTIHTNVASDKVPGDFKMQATKIVADSLGKPPSYVAIHINPNQNISFGGTDEPAALCDLVSIGCLSVELNKLHSEDIMKYLTKSLGVPPSRIYISFHNAPKGDIGYDNTTFDDLM